MEAEHECPIESNPYICYVPVRDYACSDEIEAVDGLSFFGKEELLLLSRALRYTRTGRCA